MNIFDKLSGRLVAPKLTRGRIAAAMTIACVADILQIVLMPVAWTFAQSAVDVVAMLLAMWVVGFHLLLLPTFIIEFIPGVDMLPTWTACMIAVIALRKREQSSGPPVIDVDPAPTTKPTELSLPTNPTPNPPPPPARD
jgi:hypothetical protein